MSLDYSHLKSISDKCTKDFEDLEQKAALTHFLQNPNNGVSIFRVFNLLKVLGNPHRVTLEPHFRKTCCNL